MARSRRTTPLVPAVALAVTLTACGLGEGPAGSADGRYDVSGEVAGEITFQTMQLSPTFDDFINGLIDEFENEYPEVTVEWVDVPTEGTAEKIAADAASGSLADVLDLDVATLAPLARDGRVLDMATVSAESKDSYVESAWRSFEFGDVETAALPWYLNTPVLVMNTSIVEDAGLDPADPPGTYAELVQHSSTIAEKTGRAGFQPTVRTLLNMMLSYGVPLINEDATEAVVDTPEALRLVNDLAELYRDGGIAADSMTAQPRSEIETFQEGEVAYFDTGPSRVTIIEENAPGTFESLAVAQGLESEADGAWVVAHGLAVPTTSENKATALEFARFVTSSTNQLALAQESTVFPSAVDALEDPFFSESGGTPQNEARAIAAENLTSGRTAPARHTAIDTEYEEELWSQLQLAIMGDEDPAEALTNAEQALTELLQRGRR
ncbi:ABC transporter substrate-binding protein [Saccharomonospora azurea]|uniref:ABC transporter substrate-binding protein n=1 Tax=Saccharomonospora azurea TaxID=40988 RepID=UPI003D948902